MRLASRATPTPTDRGRRVGILLTAAFLATAVLFWPTRVSAAPNKCDYREWTMPGNVQNCISRLDPPRAAIDDCMGVPTPTAPDSGFGGWFASDPKLGPGISGLYSTYGYGGYSYPVYDPGCAAGAVSLPSSSGATSTIANGELMVATGIVGAADAFRESAYHPQHLWGWSDDLVRTATKAVYQKVFSVFGVITLAAVGLYLIWRSRQADMSDALTTAGWAVLVMTVVTAVAAWPLVSAHLADHTLTSGLGVIHSAVGPRPKDIPVSRCVNAVPHPPPGVEHDPALCKDHRPTSVIASDTATRTILYNNWLRGTLGSATSTTAKKYGMALYQSSTLSWDEATAIAKDPDKRKEIVARKSDDFRRVADQIRTEDPGAYHYLQGKEGSARIGAGLIAILSAVAFSFFDIAASLLVILGFLIFRWAVVAIPIIGTIAILRPAGGGFKRLVNIVVAAIFNILIFGAGASVYLFAVDIIMNTATLPGWLQITLVWLCGIVGWLLLRPYRRITQLGGKNPMGELAGIGSWHRRVFGDLKGVAVGAAGAAVLGDIEAQDNDEKGTKKATAEQTADTAAPATAGSTDPAAGSQDGRSAPAGPGTDGQPRDAAPRPATAGGQHGGYQDDDLTVDDRVWVPATGRYAGERGDPDDLADMTAEADARIRGGSAGAEPDAALHTGSRGATRVG